jgi:hypothetical protein
MDWTAALVLFLAVAVLAYVSWVTAWTATTAPLVATGAPATLANSAAAVSSVTGMSADAIAGVAVAAVLLVGALGAVDLWRRASNYAQRVDSLVELARIAALKGADERLMERHERTPRAIFRKGRR